MNLSYNLKDSPNHLQALIRPMLLISLTLHGLFLLMPMPEEKAKSVPKKEKTVKVTQLALPPSKPAARTTPKTRTATRPKVTPRTSRPVQSISRRQPIIQAVKPKPVQTPPQSRQVAPAPSPSPTSPAESPNVESTNQPVNATDTPLAEFPHFLGAKPGCLEVPSCFQTANDLEKVAAHFEKELPAKKFTISTNVDEPGRKVYELSRSDFLLNISA
jgi:hypothetical protein